jgi:hypothetical protein
MLATIGGPCFAAIIRGAIFFFYFLKFIYSYVHKLFGPFVPPAPYPLSLPPHPSLPERTCSALFSNFVEE